MSSKKSTHILIGIIALAVIARLSSSTSPAIAAIAHAFPQASDTAVESIATIGDAAAVISALLIGKMLNRWSFKWIALISVAILSLGGLLPLLLHQSVNQLLLWGFIAGLGTGGITTLLPSLQAYAFDGEKLATMLGIVVAIENGSSMLLVFFSGLLASQNWLHAYYLFFLALITLVITCIVIPNRRPDQKNEGTPANEVVTTLKISQIIYYLLAASVMVLLEAVLYNKNALYIQQFKLGSPALAGKIMMLDGLAAIVVGLIIRWLRRLFKKYILVFNFSLVILGSLLLLTWHSAFSIAIATFVIGAASASTLMTVPYILSTLTPAQHYPLVMGIFSAITSLGFSSSALLFNSIVGHFTKNLLQGTYIMQLIIATVMGILLISTTYWQNHKS
ncbi:MFS transporter [Bombilactobacillus thymidiniphilus]|uniref:MFS transporter n=1 Tax=Bombilactobacillus thymidiniphilus TaxID=2923363 RepID=A0ABY4PCX5_9LACO|nr:MFS transporter [Bombilactobacillus thymidiniphilus]UQS83127.1 MFS transporter [Bombilactobacillus thymidiniphilus]